MAIVQDANLVCILLCVFKTKQENRFSSFTWFPEQWILLMSVLGLI